MAKPTLPARAAAPPAQQPAPPLPPPPPPRPQQDGATLIQEQLDKLALACFNTVLEVTKARAGDSSGEGQQRQEQQRAKVSELGLEIGTLLREMEETIDGLPVLPLLAAREQQPENNSVEATRARLKELQAEYEKIHQELKETVTEAGTFSTKLRHTLASHKV